MKPSTPTRHKSYAEIDVAALRSNLRILKNAVGTGRKVILVVKSDAYGHGAGAVAAIAGEEGINNFAVASVDEGIQLRRADVTGEILVLHPPSDYDFPAVTEWHLSPSISSEESAALYSRLAGSETLTVHVEINTGLSRLGLNWETATDSIARIAALPNLRIGGIYTHYRAHYSPVGDAIQEQTDRFQSVLDELRKRGIDPGFCHAASSYPAVYHHTSTLFDGIRIGIIAYGAMESLPQPVTGIQPVMSVRSCIMHLRRIKAGEWVHYGDGFQAPRNMTIAVIPIGYGMGFTRHLSNNGEMLIQGKRCPIVGVVGMDMTMLDVSALSSPKAGDPVTVIGRDGQDEITALEIAQHTGTIAYEITCRLGNGLPRYVTKQTASQMLPSGASALRG
jgi:alanine racemase